MRMYVYGQQERRISLFFSPATTDDLLFRCLSPVELYRYAQTSKAAYLAVMSYVRRAFQSIHGLAIPCSNRSLAGEDRIRLLSAGRFNTAVQRFHTRTSYRVQVNAHHVPQPITSEYAGASFIYDFQKSNSSRRIQLILSQTDRPPIEMLLNFHSSVWSCFSSRQKY